jgi:hypothetical protein
MAKSEITPVGKCLMTKKEAESFVKSIKSRARDMVEMAIELHDRLGWKVLGYDSWEACVEVEFHKTLGWNRQSSYRMMRHRKINVKLLELSPIGDTLAPKGGCVPESHARATAGIEDLGTAAQVIHEAIIEKTSAGKPPEAVTAADIKRHAKPYLPPKSPPGDATEPQEGDSDEPEEELEPVLDGEGNAVPDEAVGAFTDDLDEGKEILSDIRQLDNRIKKWSGTIGGSQCSHAAAVVRLRETKAAVSAALPWVICPNCPGTGCTICGGRRFLLKTQVDTKRESSEPQRVVLNRQNDTRYHVAEAVPFAEANRLLNDLAAEKQWPRKEQSKA